MASVAGDVLVVAVALGYTIFSGLVSRVKAETALAQETKAQSVPTVCGDLSEGGGGRGRSGDSWQHAGIYRHADLGALERLPEGVVRGYRRPRVRRDSCSRRLNRPK